jgi:hypothetical protein
MGERRTVDPSYYYYYYYYYYRGALTRHWQVRSVALP